MKISTSNAKRLITRFENAVREHAFREHAFIGTTPAGKSEAAAAAYDAVQREFEMAKTALTTFCIEAVIGEPQPKLFVWENILTDHTDGMIVVLALDLDQAYELIEKKDNLALNSAKAQEPSIITLPEAFTVWGGR